MPVRLQWPKPDFERARRCRNRLWHFYPGVSTKAQSRLLALKEGEKGRSEHDRLERHFRERWMSCRDGGPEETGQQDGIILLVIDFQGS